MASSLSLFGHFFTSTICQDISPACAGMCCQVNPTISFNCCVTLFAFIDFIWKLQLRHQPRVSAVHYLAVAMRVASLWVFLYSHASVSSMKTTIDWLWFFSATWYRGTTRAKPHNSGMCPEYIDFSVAKSHWIIFRAACLLHVRRSIPERFPAQSYACVRKWIRGSLHSASAQACTLIV